MARVLAFQASYAGSIPVARSKEQPKVPYPIRAPGLDGVGLDPTSPDRNGKTHGVTEQQNKQKPPRSTSSWVAIAGGMFLLVVLLVFILQNSKEVKVSFFTVHWRAPLAVDLLFATVLGGLIVFAAGSVHIIQLRRAVRHHRAASGDPGPAAEADERHRRD